MSSKLWRKLARNYGIDAAIILFGFAAIHFVFWFPAFRGDTVDRTAAGLFGDFVGGYVGTFFALVSVVLLVRTLRHQRDDFHVQNFIAKYFELIKMHRDNVAEMELQDAKGRRIFVLLVREFRAILVVARQLAEKHQLDLNQQQLLHVAYYCLFFGTGPNSSRMLKASLMGFDQQYLDAIERELSDDERKKAVQQERNLGYVPFEGHLSRLGHYYRHLYQTVGFVDRQNIEIDKYEYVKTIRAQLSTHEQALLLLNSLCPLGRKWNSEGFMSKYRMVKNIPRNFFSSATELDLSTLNFGPDYFEWEEAQ